MSDSASAPASSPSPPPPPPSSTSTSSLTVNVAPDSTSSTTTTTTSTSTTPKALTPSSLSASTIAEYKQKLETFTTPETKDITAAVDILNTLMTVTISAETLAATKIGVLVNQLRKHDNKEVAYTCRALLERWKKAVQPIIARTSSVTDQIRKDKATPSKSTSEQKSSAPTTPTPTTPTTPNGTLTKTISNPPVRRTSSTTPATSTSASTSTSTSTTSSTSTSTTASTSTTSTPPLARAPVGTPGQYPTFISNGLTMGKTGDSFRNKIQQLIYDGLLRAATSTSTCLEMSVTLESCLYKHFGNKTDAPYKNRYREIAMNIKDENNDLADRLFNGKITCERLVSMPVQEMASDSLQKQREEERVYARDATRSDWNRDRGTTEMFQCGKCKQKKCKYYQMQTRSADEPMTTFVTCMNCGNRWKC